jgi:hypothetical protein
MNSPFVVEESRHVAGRREIDTAPPNRTRVQALYHLVYGRDATAEEAQLALDFVNGKDVKSPATKEPNLWQFGLISFNPRGEVSNFEPMKYFVNQMWQPASLTPQPIFGDAELSAKGGVPTDDPGQAVTRRWTSPISGIVEITGTLANKVESSPEEYREHWSGGVRARVIFNRRSTVAEAQVNNGKSNLLVRELRVKPGDTIDFAVNCVKNSQDTEFTWAPVITLKSAGTSQAWDAGKDFHGPSPAALDAWGKLAQTLFETSEFAFVD